MNAQPDDASADDQLPFADLLTPPLLPGTVEFNEAYLTLGAALFQTPSALRKVQSSSQNNLVDLAGNTFGPSNFNVPPPFTPPRDEGWNRSGHQEHSTSIEKKGN